MLLNWRKTGRTDWQIDVRSAFGNQYNAMSSFSIVITRRKHSQQFSCILLSTYFLNDKLRMYKTLFTFFIRFRIFNNHNTAITSNERCAEKFYTSEQNLWNISSRKVRSFAAEDYATSSASTGVQAVLVWQRSSVCLHARSSWRPQVNYNNDYGNTVEVM